MRLRDLTGAIILILLVLLAFSFAAAQDLTPTPMPTPTMTPGPTPTPGPTGLGCEESLGFRVNEVVYVRPGVLVRHRPSRSGAPVNYYTEPMVAVITDGPVCADNYNWWHIRAPGNDGWIAEGTVEAGYFLESAGYTTDGELLVRTCNEPLDVTPGESVRLADNVRVRENPGRGGRVETIAPADSNVEVLGGPECVDGLNWWRVRATVVDVTYEGWMVENWMLTTRYLETADCIAPLPLSVGQRAHVTYDDFTPKALRVAPGRDSALLNTLVGNVPFEIIGGPVCVDGLNWWQIRVLASNPVTGWMAEGGPGDYWIETIDIDERYR